MKRGDVIVAAEKGAFSGKPRPWLVLQNDAFLNDAATVTVCMISTGINPSFARIPIAASDRNGLSEPSTVMTDKVLTLRRRSISRVVGRLDDGALARVDEALRLWLDL